MELHHTILLLFSAAPERWMQQQQAMAMYGTFVPAMDELSLRALAGRYPEAVLVVDIASPGRFDTPLSDLVRSVRPNGALMIEPSIDTDSCAAAIRAMRAAPRPPMLANTAYPTIPPVPRQEAHSNHVVLCGSLLGPFQLTLNGVLFDHWPSKKGKLLLAYLLYHHQRPRLRDVLIEHFWPDVGFDSAKNSLHVALHGIRRLLRQIVDHTSIILCDNERYFVNPDVDLRLDCEAFLQAYDESRRSERNAGLEEAVGAYERALGLYTGDFMEDDLYNEWLCSERAMLREKHLVVLDRLSHHYATTRQYARAIAFCDRILQEDSCREEVHRRLMRCYYRTGRRAHAIKQFQRCEEALHQELDVAPSTATLDLVARIKEEAVEH